MLAQRSDAAAMPAASPMLIGGELVGAASGRAFAVANPADDAIVGAAPDAGADETRQAIDAASAALPAWRDTPAPRRGELLRAFGALMLRDLEPLARTMTLEQGKPLAEARNEINYARSFLEWAAGEAPRIYGETIPASVPTKRLLVLRQPYGVCAAITPWNFPAAMIVRKLGPALAAGCTMVVKPAEDTPLTALALGRLAIEAGLPPGVVNIVTGDAATIAGELLSNPAVRKLSFTGSTEVGRILMRQAAQNLVRLSLELGGHAPLIVFDDADLDQAANGAIASKFRNAGQTCVCANRIYVQERIHDRFAALLCEKAAALRVGNGLDEGVQLGPLINDAAVEKVRGHVADAAHRGAHVALGGSMVELKGLSRRFFAPTILAGATAEMLVAREETFGPIAPLFRFSTEEEAVRLANDSPYGLAAYFFTRDASRLIRVAEALEYGIVGANDALPATAQAPFGGMKHSGFGREGGREGVMEYVQTKFVSWGV